MAEFIGQEKPERTKSGPNDGFNAMGKPIPLDRRTNAANHMRQMGVTDAEDVWTCVAMVAGQLERDAPYEALRHAMKYLDLTGSYRLIAVLLTDAA
jgi:hypothetical protein